MDYQDKVIGTSPLAYWPLNELSGQTCLDLIAGRNGAGSGLTRAYTGPNSTPATEFNSSLVDLLPGGIGAVFPLSEGTIMAWCRCDEWASSSIRYVFRAQDSIAASDLRFHKNGTNRFSQRFETDLGGRVDQNLPTPFDPAGWFPAFFLWDATSLQIKANWGTKISKTITAPFTRPLTLSDIGYGWIGALCHVAIWNTMLSDAQLSNLEAFSMADLGNSFWTYVDYGGDVPGEQSTVSLSGIAVTAGNHAAQEALHDALTAAFAGVIISASLKKHSFGNVEINATTTSLSPLNQRENKWLCRCSIL